MTKADLELKVEVTGKEEAFDTLDRLNSKLETLKQNLKEVRELSEDTFA